MSETANLPAAGENASRAASVQSGGISHAWRALRNRNFRLYFNGQSVSLIGTWMNRTATAWLVYRLTHSALMLGTIGFAGQVPTFFIAPFAGVWIDRFDRRRLLLCTQIVLMLQSCVLTALLFTRAINIEWILVLSILQGAVNAIEMPCRQAILARMVDDPADLSNAIAINSSMVNGARLIGPSIAGLVIAATNEGWCFFIDAVSYIAVIASLLSMRLRQQQAPQRAAASALAEMKEGWSYVSGFVSLRSILALSALVSLLGNSFIVLMPIFAAQVLHGGSNMLGFLIGSSGLGAFVAAVSLAARRSVRGLDRTIATACVILGASLIAFGLSRVAWLSILTALMAGVGILLCATGGNTVVHSIIADDKRGRVLAFYTMATVGMVPFGSLVAGTLGKLIGAPLTVIFSGFLLLAGGGWFTTRLPAIRRETHAIFERKGLIPPSDSFPQCNGPTAST